MGFPYLRLPLTCICPALAFLPRGRYNICVNEEPAVFARPSAAFIPSAQNGFGFGIAAFTRNAAVLFGRGQTVPFSYNMRDP